MYCSYDSAILCIILDKKSGNEKYQVLLGIQIAD